MRHMTFHDLFKPSAQVTIADLKKLRHCLGIHSNYPRKEWGYRNHYISNGKDEGCERLCAAGLMETVPVNPAAVLPEPTVFYRATYAGMELVGLSKKILKAESSRIKKLWEAKLDAKEETK